MNADLRSVLGNEGRTVLRWVLTGLFMIAMLAAIAEAANASGAARWWWVAGIIGCSWSGAWVDRSRLFKPEDEEEEEEDAHAD